MEEQLKIDYLNENNTNKTNLNIQFELLETENITLQNGLSQLILEGNRLESILKNLKNIF